MKKQLFLFVLLLSSIGMSAEEFEVAGIKYGVLTTSPDYTVEVTGYNADYEGDLVLNGTVTYNTQNYKVVSIKGGQSYFSGAFHDCQKTITINDLPYCTSIGGYAFPLCSSLTSIGDLSACTSIGISAFNGCRSLASVGDLSACTSIGSYAFYDCSLTSIGDLSACTSIGQKAFQNCSNLTSIGDLSACTSIGNDAFNGCSSLTSIGDLSACTSIGNNAFYGCSSLTSIGDLSVCTSIGNDAFNGCSSLASVGDLSVCTSIGSGAFNGCGRLESITISSSTPPTITASIDNSDFTYLVPASAVADYRAADIWSDIKTRIISKDAQHTWDVAAPVLNSIGADQFENVMTLKLSGNIDSHDIMYIRNKMYNLHHLDMTNATIVASDKEYYSGCRTSDNSVGGFFEMSRLRTVKLPTSAKVIESGAFSSCSYLYDIVIPVGIERIDGGFWGCSSLTTVQLPEGVTSVGNSAFNGCSKLSAVAFPSTLTTIGQYAFQSCPLISVSLPEHLISIGASAFNYNTSLTELRIPSSLESIGAEAFSGCSNLKDIYTYTVLPININSNTFDPSTYDAAKLHLPTQGFNDYYSSYTWGQFKDMVVFNEPYKYFYISDDFILLSGKRFDTPQGEDLDINAHAGSSITIEGETNQEVGNIDIHDDGTSGASIIPDNNLTAKTVTFHIQVGAQKWRFFCFPFPVYLNKVEAPGAYVFRRYNGSNRALGNTGWESLPVETQYLEAGVGYIYQCNVAGTLKITVSTPDFSWATSSKTNTLMAYTAANDQDASWNFIGNPMTNYYDIDDMHYDAPLTVWNGTNYVAYRPGDDNYQLQPFEAYFVQKPNDSSVPTYDKDKRMGHNAAVTKHNQKAAAAARSLNPEQRDRHLLNLVLSNGEQDDQTRVVFNEKKTVNYEKECDAAKFMSSEQVPMLYSTDHQTRYAINERPKGSVQLGFVAPKAGTYTLRAERMDMAVMLRDNVTGTSFDLKNGDYTFESEAGTFNARFMVMPAGSTPTVVDPVEAAAKSESTIYTLDGKRLPEAGMTRGVVIEDGKKVVK